MKVKNTSRRVIKLLNGSEKVTLIPGSSDAYEVTNNADVKALLEKGELTETVEVKEVKAKK